MDKVHLIKANFLENLGKTAKYYARGVSSGDKIVIKAHMGEYGNLAYVRPPIIGVLVEELKKVGAKPVLLDTTTAYHGPRHIVKDYLETARKNGFTKETIGCPVRISDKFVPVEWPGQLEKLELSKEIAEADAMVVVSHFKGHLAAGFGGGIKNLGMGAVSKKTKWKTHKLAQPKIAGNCKGCGACVKACFAHAVSLAGKKAKIDYERCWGCGQCVAVCPSKALGQKANIPELLAQIAKQVLGTFDRNKLLFVNVLLDITPRCDCADNPGFPVVPNIGILVSDNIIEADKASLDLVNKAAGKDIFKEIHHINPDDQISAGIKLGLGDGKYEVVER